MAVLFSAPLAHASATQMAILNQPVITNLLSGNTAGLFVVAEQDANNNTVVDPGGITLTITGSGSSTCWLGTSSASGTTNNLYTDTLTTGTTDSNANYPYSITPAYNKGIAVFDLSTLYLNAITSACTFTFQFTGVTNSSIQTASYSAGASGNVSPQLTVNPTSFLYVVTTTADPGTSPACTAYATVPSTSYLNTHQNNCPFRTAYAKNSVPTQAITFLPLNGSSAATLPITITFATTMDGTNELANYYISGLGPNNVFLSGGGVAGVAGLKSSSLGEYGAFYISGLTFENMHNAASAGAFVAYGGPDVFNNVNFVNDERDGGGGAIFTYQYNISGLVVNSCQFLGDNSQETGTTGAQGGAISDNSESPMSVTNSMFVGNYLTSTGDSSNYGGAIYYTPSSSFAPVNLGPLGNTLNNDTFVGNYIYWSTAGAYNSRGGAVYLAQNAAFTTGSPAYAQYLTNDTFYGNFAYGNINNNMNGAEGGALFTSGETNDKNVDYLINDLFTGNGVSQPTNTSAGITSGGAIYADGNNLPTVYNMVTEGNMQYNITSGSGTDPDIHFGGTTTGAATSWLNTGSTSAITYPGVGLLGGSTVDGLGTADIGLGVGYVQVTAGGSGYTGTPTVTFDTSSACTVVKSTGATTTQSCCKVTPLGQAIISSNVITGISITNPGAGCTGVPPVTITGGSGSGATAQVTEMASLYGGGYPALPSGTTVWPYIYTGQPATADPLPGSSANSPLLKANESTGYGASESLYGTVQGVNITSPGAYTSNTAPTITFTGGGCATEPTATATMGIASTVVTTTGSCAAGIETAVAFSAATGCSTTPPTATGTFSTTANKAVTAVNMLNYSSCTAVPTVSFTGGTCTTTPAATAYFGVVNVSMTGNGAGCTSAPAVTFSGASSTTVTAGGGSGSGATFGGQATGLAVVVPTTDARGVGNRPITGAGHVMDLGPANTYNSATTASNDAMVFNTQSNVATSAAFSPQPVLTLEDGSYPLVAASQDSVSAQTPAITLALHSGNSFASGTNPESLAYSSTTGYYTATWTNLAASATAYTGDYLTAAAVAFWGGSGNLPTTNSNTFNEIGSASQLVFTAAPTSPITSGSTSGSVQVSVEDSAGNVLTSNTSTVYLQVSCSACSPSYTTSYTNVAAVAGVATFSGGNLPTLTIAGSYTYTACSTSNCSGGLTQPTASETVNAGSATQLAFGTSPSASITAGNTSSQLTVLIEDTNGNLTTSTSTVYLQVSCSACSPTYTTSYTNVAAVSGTATFLTSNLPTLTIAGSYTYRACSTSNCSGGLTQPTASETVNAGALASVAVTSSYPSADDNGIASNFVVTAEDSYGNTTSTGLSSGSVTLTSSDPLMSYGLSSYSGGVYTFSVTLYTAGTQSITAADGGINVSQGSITVSSIIWVLNSSGTVVSLTPAGTGSTDGSGGSSGTGGDAVDSSGRIWTVTSGSNTLTMFSRTGSSNSSYSGGGLNEPVAVTVDPGGSVWVANSGNKTVSLFNSSGTALSPSSGFVGPTAPTGIAVDPSGTVWVSNSDGTMTALLGTGATP